jgi:hypothetical protein
MRRLECRLRLSAVMQTYGMMVSLTAEHEARERVFRFLEDKGSDEQSSSCG